MAMQIKRRIGNPTAPGSGTAAAGQLIYHQAAASGGAAGNLYIGDGDPGIPRLLVGNIRQVETHGNQSIAGHKTFTDDVTVTGDAIILKIPVNDTDAANKLYVDQAVASGQAYSGEFNPTSTTSINEILNRTTKINGQHWSAADPGGPLAAPMAPLSAGTQFNPGDTLTWRDQPAPNGTYSHTSVGGITMPEADQRYLRLIGGTITSNNAPQLTIHSTTTAPALLRTNANGHEWQFGTGANEAFVIGDVDSSLIRLSISPSGTVHIEGPLIVDGMATLSGGASIDDGTY